VKEGKKQGSKEGRKEGRKKGRKEGRREGEKEGDFLFFYSILQCLPNFLMLWQNFLDLIKLKSQVSINFLFGGKSKCKDI
jgi:predicted transposase YdaD